MESWREVWRRGMAPLLLREGLLALERALLADDPRLVQGVTTAPPPLTVFGDCPIEGACPIGFTGWQGLGLTTVAAVEDFFARVCYAADKAMGEEGCCRWFFNWWDETPRAKARLLLRQEVARELAQREGVSDP